MGQQNIKKKEIEQELKARKLVTRSKESLGKAKLLIRDLSAFLEAIHKKNGLMS